MEASEETGVSISNGAEEKSNKTAGESKKKENVKETDSQEPEKENPVETPEKVDKSENPASEPEKGSEAENPANKAENGAEAKNPANEPEKSQEAGSGAALCRGVDVAKGELVIFVDSDSFLDPYAVINLVQPFQDPKMGGVAGRTDVANTYTNSLTKMQAVRYYIAFRVMKASEALFDTVTCLSGPLSCYRKEIVKKHEEDWLNQRFLGHKATFGDDRAMTNFVLKNHRTYYQDTAICSTIVPNQQKVFLKQQMRWKLYGVTT